ncbi:MAG TPA: VOC family protein [Bryobacteraceae bacterium]|nr:VOC family protein [Bryobacteraceae bacterium]
MLLRMLDESPGQIRWVDLTVANAGEMSAFYQAVVGWEREPVPMGPQEQWYVRPRHGGEPVAGICDATGGNQGLPPMWLIYITVSDLVASMDKCKKLGGEIIFGPKLFGTEGKWCVIRDPAGAVAALFEPNAVA